MRLLSTSSSAFTAHALGRLAQGPVAEILCLDVGSRRIGVAVSTMGMRIATALGTEALVAKERNVMPNDAARRCASQLERAIKEHGACGIVVGWPLELSGVEGRQCQRVRSFMDLLVGHSKVIEATPVLLWDERYSSTVATLRIEGDPAKPWSRTMNGKYREKRKRGMSVRSRRKRAQRGTVDQVAATVILQGYLDFMRTVSLM